MGERLGTTSRVRGHDVHVRFGDRTYASIRTFAEETGLALNGCVRLLVERGLATKGGAPPAIDADELADQVRALGQTALAGLIAIEETRINQALIFPTRLEGRRYTEEAASAARRRLAEVEVALRMEVE